MDVINLFAVEIFAKYFYNTNKKKEFWRFADRASQYIYRFADRASQYIYRFADRASQYILSR